MSPYGRDNAPRPFTPGELEGVDDVAPDELLVLGRVARDLEAVAERGGVRPSPDFADRVMRAIAAEPSPAPAWAAGLAVRRHSLRAMVASFRDAVRVSFGTGFPIAVRAQALALVLTVTAVVATGSGVATVGAVHLLSGNPPSGFPDATSQPVVTIAPETPDGSLDPSAVSASPDMSEPGEPSVSEQPDPSPSEAPGKTPEPTAGSGGPSHGGDQSPAPTETPHPTESDPHDQGGGSGGPGDTPNPTERAQPTASPTPSPTPVQEPIPSPDGTPST